MLEELDLSFREAQITYICHLVEALGIVCAQSTSEIY